MPDRLNRQLDALAACLAEHPLEDGRDHPGEAILDDALTRMRGADTLARLRPSALADGPIGAPGELLKLLGRMTAPGSADWRAALIGDALAHADVRVRDAAVQAAEGLGRSGFGSVAGRPPRCL